VLFVAAAWVGLPKKASSEKVRPMFWYLAGVAVYLFLLNGLMAVDTFLLKRLSHEWFWHRLMHGAAPPHQWFLGVTAPHEADRQVGYYRGVKTRARLPYQLMLAVTFIVFPLVSRATFQKDAEKTRIYIRTTMRYSLIFAGAMGAVLAANPYAI